MSLLLGPSPSGNSGPSIKVNVSRERRAPVNDRGTQAKAFRAFAKTLDSLTFDSQEFGYMMTLLIPAIQKRILTAFMAYFRILSEQIDRGLLEVMDDDQIILAQNAKIVYDVLKDSPLIRE